MTIEIGRSLTEKYRDSWGRRYYAYTMFARIGYSCKQVLPELIGTLCDDVAMAYIHSLRPSLIRITTGTITADSQLWRVTVYVTHDNRITNIEQEVEVGLPEPFGSGYELRVYSQTGKHHSDPPGQVTIANPTKGEADE